MIEVSEDQLSQVQYLLAQSIQGNHILFDHEELRRIFRQDPYRSEASILDENEAYQVEHHIERLIQQPTLAEKRAYLEMLNPKTYEWVVRTYFNIVENNLFESLDSEVRH